MAFQALRFERSSLDALPEIIALVAAAETVIKRSPSLPGMSLEARLGAVDFHLSNALYPLASKLSGEGQ